MGMQSHHVTSASRKLWHGTKDPTATSLGVRWCASGREDPKCCDVSKLQEKASARPCLRAEPPTHRLCTDWHLAEATSCSRNVANLIGWWLSPQPPQPTGKRGLSRSCQSFWSKDWTCGKMLPHHSFCHHPKNTWRFYWHLISLSSVRCIFTLLL